MYIKEYINYKSSMLLHHMSWWQFKILSTLYIWNEHKSMLNLGQLKVNLSQNLDKVVKSKGLMGKKKSITIETMTKNGKYSSDWKWEKFNQQFFLYYLLLLFLLGDQKNLDCHINGEDQPCQWLDIWKLVNENFKKKHLIIWWLKV